MSFRSIESEGEKEFVKELKKWSLSAYTPVLTFKLSIPGNRGWPDRIVLWRGPSLMFIEFKRAGEKPRKLQEFVHNTLRDFGFVVEVHDDCYTALESVKAKVRSDYATDKRHGADSKERRLSLVHKAGPRKDRDGP